MSVPAAVRVADVPEQTVDALDETVTEGLPSLMPVKSEKVVIGEVSTKPELDPVKRVHGVVPSHLPITMFDCVPAISALR
mgnify:CR=1 FL=1